ncbi:thymidylate kinase [Striga asiatica]|uniref:Thymidylate kinase n=1 Tax=Striga asiatica TaxID=4170 RepID=A0A5A7PQK7_STRAF|nr:thymidylate kinase [Striga asiatica]
MGPLWYDTSSHISRKENHRAGVAVVKTITPFSSHDEIKTKCGLLSGENVKLMSETTRLESEVTKLFAQENEELKAKIADLLAQGEKGKDAPAEGNQSLNYLDYQTMPKFKGDMDACTAINIC